ncbi:IS4 family transposase [Paenibacillaceae bacterium]|nr:IS4 family transposase [Paenibacillaceae bacterium]
MKISCGRTLNRFIRTLSTFARHPGLSIAAASRDAAEAAAIYRLLQNPKLTEENVMEGYRNETIRCMQATGESVFLCVQDTTEVNYTHLKHTPDLGNCRAPKSKGLFVHSGLVLTTSGLSLGLLHQKIWSRDPELKGQRKVNRPYEEKESYKWTETAKASKESLPSSIRLVHMGDREADFFEFFHHLEKDEQSYVVRAVQNRITEEDGRFLFDEIRQRPVAGHLAVSIPRDTRKGVPARETTLAVRYLTDTVRVPTHLQQKRAGFAPLSCTLIHVIEVTPLPDQSPIEWFLVTNLPVTSLEDASEKVAWYVKRWRIERFHYVLKSGCEVEKLQERQADRLRKLLLWYSIIALQLQHLTELARQQPEAPCTLVMEDEEWRVLYRIANKTNTVPDQPPSLREVIFALAKLGGFLGRKSDGDPGVKVIWRGLQAFRTVFENYRFLL